MFSKMTRYKKEKIRDNLIDIGLISPQLILYSLFLIVPLFIGLPIVFTSMRGFADHHREFIGLKNFYDLLIEPGFSRDMVRNSVYRNSILLILNFIMMFVIGFTFALIMYEGHFGHGYFTVIYLPMMVSQLAIGYIMLMLFSQTTGTFNLLLLKLKIISEPMSIQSSAASTWIMPLVIGWEFAGFNLAIFISGMYSIPYDTIEASIIDGTTYWQRLTRIICPQIKGAFFIATIMCITGTYQIFDQAVALGALGGNKSVEFVAVALWKFMFSFEGVGKAMTMTFIVGVPLFIIAMLLTRIQNKLRD